MYTCGSCGAPHTLGSVDNVRTKIILLGDSAVGKSKLVERFMMNEFQPRQVRTHALYFSPSVALHLRN